jgi:hypothetical protein
MIHTIDYKLLGGIDSIGILRISRTSFVERIAAVGNIDITYNLFGQALTIDGQECVYKRRWWWVSPSLIFVGHRQIRREGFRITAIGNLPVVYKRDKPQSIGDMRFSYGKFGRMTELTTTGDQDLTHEQKIALTIVLSEFEELQRNSST